MRKLLVIVGIGVVLGVAASAATEAPTASQSDSGATFELTYRGLTIPDDPLGRRSFWGFGTSDKADTPFVAAVKKRVGKYDLVFNSQLPEAMRWSLVELEDGEPIALYFDADGNGECSDNERFPCVSPQGRSFGYACAFITSDFMVRTEAGKQAPLRIMLVGHKSGAEPISYMWCPWCVLEGQATLNGRATKMVLYVSGFDGAFSTFRSASFALFDADQEVKSYVSSESLSSLISYKDTFYRLKIGGSHEKDQKVRVVLEKDTGPTGQTAMELAGQEPLRSRLTSAMIAGTADKGIYFRIGQRQTTLPVGAYKLESGYTYYGVKDSNEWRVNFDDGPEFAVTADQTSIFRLGKPLLSISAVAERDRYRDNVPAKTTFPKGTVIYISPEIKGKSGEAYMRFSKLRSQKRSTGFISRILGLARGTLTTEYIDVKPHLTITNSDGNTIASADLEYG